MERNYGIDFIKGVGLILVAALHIGIFSDTHWFPHWFVNTSMRFVVPFFFLTSGYLLFKKLQVSENKGKILLGNSIRIFRYYLVGFGICFAFDYFITRPLWQMPSVFFKGYMSGSFLGDFLYYGMLHASGFHLWFLLAMFWTGVILLVTCRKDLRNIKMLTLVALVIHLIGLFGKTQPYSQFFEIPLFPRDAVFYGLFYICLGGLWACGGINVKKYIPTQKIGWGILLFFALQLGERSALVLGMKLPWGEYWGEYFITTIPLTMLLFQYALDHSKKFKNNIMTKMGEKSIGVYILHVIGINLVYLVLWENHRELLKNPVIQVIQVIVSVGLAYITYSYYLKIYDMMKKYIPTKGKVHTDFK